MSLLEKLKKNSTIKETDVLADSKFFNDVEFAPTSVPALNIALSGSISGGLSSGSFIIAGPSRHFKTAFALVCAKAYLDKNPDAVLMFYDSEFGSPQAYFDNFGIDRNRVLHTPISSVEQLRHDISVQLEQIERKDKVIIIIDSIGNLASKKETQDALEGKDSADMTRAKVIKSLYRIITPVLKIKDIPLISICHVYQTMELYSKAIISGGCLVAGTELIMADGSLKEIQDITVGEYVKTLQGDKPVTHIWNPETLEEGKPECVRVHFDDGHIVECSVNHPFLTKNGWIAANELSKNDEVITYE